MLRLAMLVRGLIDDDDGAALAEYAVLFLVVATGAVVALGALSDSLELMFNNMAAFIDLNITGELAPG